MFGTGKSSRRWLIYYQMLESLPYIPLFQDLDPAQIALLKPLFEQFTCPADTVIFEQDAPAIYLYLLIKGEVAIRYKPYDGPLITLTRLREGDVFGWSAVVGSPCYTSSIVSESPVEAIRIRGNRLIKLFSDAPETGKVVMDRLARIVSPRWGNAHAQVQSLLSVDQK
jgi:CRP/FNR family transcriptional regulator, cyclic AMP receptor protein